MKVSSALATALFVAVVLVGCGDKKSGDNQQTSATSAPAAAAAVTNPVGPNWSTPLDKYLPVNDDTAVAHLFFAIKEGESAGVYSDLTPFISDEYLKTTDVFKKNEIEKSLKPKIDERIQEFRKNRYVVIVQELELSEYSFQNHNFPLNHNLAASPEETIMYRSPMPGGDMYALWNVNCTAGLPMPDVDKAKAIEQLRKANKLRGWTSRVYAYASGAKATASTYNSSRRRVPGARTVYLDVHKVVFLDDKKNVVAEFVVPK